MFRRASRGDGGEDMNRAAADRGIVLTVRAAVLERFSWATRYSDQDNRCRHRHRGSDAIGT